MKSLHVFPVTKALPLFSHSGLFIVDSDLWRSDQSLGKSVALKFLQRQYPLANFYFFKFLLVLQFIFSKEYKILLTFKEVSGN